jgi:hypothetical protein
LPRLGPELLYTYRESTLRTGSILRRE